MSKSNWMKKRKVQVYSSSGGGYLLSEVIVQRPGAPKWILYDAYGCPIGTFYNKKAATKATHRLEAAQVKEATKEAGKEGG